MPLLFTDLMCLEHDTGHHPECAERLARVIAMLRRTGLDKRFAEQTFEPAKGEDLARIHNSNYINLVSKFAEKGGGRIEADTVVSPASFDVAKLACGAGVAAVDAILKGEEKRATCLVRRRAKPRRLAAACWRVLVMKGAPGRLDVRLVWIDAMR